MSARSVKVCKVTVLAGELESRPVLLDRKSRYTYLMLRKALSLKHVDAQAFVVFEDLSDQKKSGDIDACGICAKPRVLVPVKVQMGFGLIVLHAREDLRGATVQLSLKNEGCWPKRISPSG